MGLLKFIIPIGVLIVVLLVLMGAIFRFIWNDLFGKFK